MSLTLQVISQATGRLRRPVVLLCLGLWVSIVQTSQTQGSSTGALQFFKNYFLTGGSGRASSTLHLRAVAAAL